MADETERTLTTPITRDTVRSLKLFEVLVTYQTDTGEILSAEQDFQNLSLAMKRRLVDTCVAHLEAHYARRSGDE